MINTDENKRYSIASLSLTEMRAYFNVKLSGTKSLKAVNKALNSLDEKDLIKLASEMGDDFKTDHYWQLLEYHFGQLFIHNQ